MVPLSGGSLGAVLAAAAVPPARLAWPPSPWTALVLGLLVGHAVRRLTPWLLGLRDRRPPFARPWPELVSGAAFAVLAWLGSPWPAWVLAVFLLAATTCDLRSKLIPDRVTFGGALVGLVLVRWQPDLVRAVPLHDLLVLELDLAFRGPWTGPLLAASGALVGFALVWAIRVVFRALAGVEAMGLGDAKLLLLVGAYVGPVGALLTLALSFFVGALHGAVSTWRTGAPHFAFGPSLAAAAGLVAAGAERLVEGIGAFQSFLVSLPLPVLAGGYSLLLAVVLLMIWRLRQRAAEYEAMIEEDYRRIEEELE